MTSPEQHGSSRQQTSTAPSIKLVAAPAARAAGLPPRAHFIEHVFDMQSRSATDTVIAGDGDAIHVSHDLGKTWRRHDLREITGGVPVVRSFTLRDGNRLLQTAREPQTMLVDPDWTLIQRCRTGPYGWHGTFSIDQSASGVVMFGEYTGEAHEIAIWRSTDGGRNWSRSLVKAGLSAATPDIRHWHTCVADPYQPGRWLASSGDAPPHDRIWLSEDDGHSWTEVPAPEPQDRLGLGLDAPRRLYRFTAPWFGPDHIIWPTDDTLGIGKAGLVVADRRMPQRLRLAGKLGGNEMRSLVALEDGSWVAISESKLDLSGVDIFHIGTDFSSVALERIPNLRGIRSGFTRTMCSRAARNGVFFSFDDGGLLEPDCRFIRWEVHGPCAEMAKVAAQPEPSLAKANWVERLRQALGMRSSFSPADRPPERSVEPPAARSVSEQPRGGLKPWAQEAIEWLANAGEDRDRATLVYRQAARLKESPYLQRQAQAIAAAASMTGLEALRAGQHPTTRDIRETFSLAGFDWRAPALPDRTQLWAVQQWLAVREALAGNGDGDPAALAPLGGWIRNWLDVNLREDSLTQNRHLAWHDHTTALRVVPALQFLRMLALAGADIQAVFPRLAEFVGVHLILLSADSFYSRRTNHGFDQAVALYLLANMFDLGSLTEHGRRIGRDRLLDEMSFAFSEEGIHIENSPSYHPIMLNRLLLARDLLAEFGDTPGDLDIDGIYRKGVEFLAHALRPDGVLPGFGDTDASVLRFEPSRELAPNESGYLAYALSGGEEGSPPPHSVRVFPRTGYAFARNLWAPPGQFDRTIQLGVKCGFRSVYHRHDDDNNVVLFAHGEEWLIESGIYRYAEADPIRMYLRSSLAHNIVTPLGANVSRIVPPADGSSGFRSWNTIDGVSEFRVRSTMFEGVLYDRTIRFDRRNGELVLRDELDDRQGLSRDYDLRLHFPNDKRIEIYESSEIRVTSLASGRSLLLSISGSAAVVPPVLLRECSHPVFGGWRSLAIGNLVSAQTLSFRASAQRHFSSEVRLRFDGNDLRPAGPALKSRPR